MSIDGRYNRIFSQTVHRDQRRSRPQVTRVNPYHTDVNRAAPSQKTLRRGSALASTDAVTARNLASLSAGVHAHEQAHQAALGAYAAGPIRYDYLIMPDGTRYAIGGSIAVNLKSVPGDPEATIRKALTLIAAAYAPVTPSGADQQVAAAAWLLLMEAKQELAREQQQGVQSGAAAPGAGQTAPPGADKPPAAFSGAEDLQGPEHPPVPGDPEATLRRARALLAASFSVTGSAAQAKLAAQAYRLEMAARREMERQDERVSLYA